MRRLTNNIAAATLIYALLGGATVWGQQPADTPPSAGKTTSAAASKEAPAVAKVNINTADQATLVSLKGVGKKRAQAIIEYREKNGPFKTVNDLTKVKGIGDKQFTKLKDQVTVE
ncbi:MAG TPA: ComEA family DNA-binding protein [Candidatus Binatia bacterium]|jgi:competence protein ComEA|nr:ComEA family DNA-binding protein [Candidatus Binatia bacterium]